MVNRSRTAPPRRRPETVAVGGDSGDCRGELFDGDIGRHQPARRLVDDEVDSSDVGGNQWESRERRLAKHPRQPFGATRQHHDVGGVEHGADVVEDPEEADVLTWPAADEPGSQRTVAGDEDGGAGAQRALDGKLRSFLDAQRTDDRSDESCAVDAELAARGAAVLRRSLPEPLGRCRAGDRAHA